MQVVKMCREHFDFVLPSLRLDRRVDGEAFSALQLLLT